MKRKEMTLSKMEFKVMDIIWERQKATCCWDIMDMYDEPKPAYTTLASYLKILTEKGFLEYYKEKGCRKTHYYVPLVTRAEYTRQTMKDVKKNFFGGSLKSLISFFVSEEPLSEAEKAELMAMIQEGGE